MTRQDVIEDLQSRIRKNRITTVDDLKLEISCAEYDGNEPIDEFEDVILPMGYNTCEICGGIEDSELGLFWLDGFDWQEDNEFDKAVLKALSEEKVDYCAICYPCLHKLANKGRDESDLAKAKKYYTEEYVVQIKQENESEPVCFDEFYWNDWQEIRKTLK